MIRSSTYTSAAPALQSPAWTFDTHRPGPASVPFRRTFTRKAKPAKRGRRVLVDGKVSLLNFKYHVGRYLAGQSVELVCHDGLVEVCHDAVLVATHARRHLPEQEERVLKQALAAAPKRPASDRVVVRKGDRNGSVSFAGANYRVGDAFRGRQVEVSLAGDTVQIWSDDRIISYARDQTRPQEGAWCLCEPRWQAGPDQCSLVPCTTCRAGTGAVLSCGYRDLTHLLE